MPINKLHIIRGLINLKSALLNSNGSKTAGLVATIGNYDGIHLGHQKILKEVVDLSSRVNLPNLLITFEPQPYEYFHPNATPQRLMNWHEKAFNLSELGLNNLLILRFNQQLAQQSAISFVEELLVKALNVKYIIVGEDFKFGHKNSGNVQFLKGCADKYNFKVISIPLYELDGYRISSSLIRENLIHGDLATVQKLLGHSYSILGRVISGDKRGRDFGFPTANIHLHHRVIPLAGVYVVKVWIDAVSSLTQSQPFYGVANIGIRPTIGNNRRLLEVYIFNFNQNIYGKILKIDFMYKLRDEKKFANFALLQQQIQQDIIDAKKLLRLL